MVGRVDEDPGRDSGPPSSLAENPPRGEPWFAFLQLEKWPNSARIVVLILILIYAPTVQMTASRWLSTEQYNHGIFIFPIAFYLLWLKRAEILSAERRPSAWGMLFIVVGLVVQVASYYLNFEFFNMLSLLPVIAGVILLFHGPKLWRVVAFPVCFLGFGANLPGIVLNEPSRWIQHVSAAGAASTMKFLGFTVMRHGNLIDVPGMTLEVADVCSGFRKLTALIVFSILYGYLFPIGIARRSILVAAVVPVSIIVNIVRLCVLVAAATFWGANGEGMLHGPAELFVLVVAFVATIRLGGYLGCIEPRFSLFSRSS